MFQDHFKKSFDYLFVSFVHFSIRVWSFPSQFVSFFFFMLELLNFFPSRYKLHMLSLSFHLSYDFVYGAFCLRFLLLCS